LALLPRFEVTTIRRWLDPRYPATMQVFMRVRRIGVVLLFAAALTSLLNVAPHAAPPPVQPADCSLGKAVHELAQNMHIRVGLENLPGCTPSPRHQERPGRTDAPPPLATATADALNRLLVTAPEFSGRSVGDVFVIRPMAAWDDATDPLNFPTAPFTIKQVDIDSALQVLV
jgi:hypothetical protein